LRAQAQLCPRVAPCRQSVSPDTQETLKNYPIMSRVVETWSAICGFCLHHAANHQDNEDQYCIELEPVGLVARAIQCRSGLAQKDLRTAVLGEGHY
jgi:hypothetical protein